METDLTPWYAARLFSARQMALGQWLAEHEIEYFIPMHYVDILDKENRVHHVLRPVVTNLIFIKRTLADKDLLQLVSDAPYKFSIITKSRENKEFAEIPAREMYEFQMMCNPEIELRKYLSEEETKLKAGTPVRVKFGPLKGLSGKLVRSSKKYYLLKEVPGMGVMLKVSRWCCVPVG